MNSLKKVMACVSLIGMFAVVANAGTINLVQDYGTTPVVGTDNVVAVSDGAVGGWTWYAHYTAAEDGNGMYFAYGAVTTAGSSVAYGFNAGENQEFVGNFSVDMMVFAGIYGGSWGSVSISYSYDNTNWTTLKDVTTRNGEAWDGNSGVEDAFSGELSFDADGQTSVYVKADVFTRYYVQNGQLARLEFTGETQAIPEPMTMLVLLGGMAGTVVCKRLKK